MRFLVVNHPRLGASPGGIPDHIVTDRSAHSARAAWFRAIELAVEEHVHAVFLTGEIIARPNPGLEPFGPLVDGIAQLQQEDIPIVAVSDGVFTPAIAKQFRLDQSVQFVDDRIDWDPPVTTSRELIDGESVHIVAASLAESTNAPVLNPITLDEIDHPGSIWMLTDALQPDVMSGDHALVVETGSLAPLSPEETGQHGAWIFDTDAYEATLVPMASLEYASIAVDLEAAISAEDVERIISQALISAADDAHGNGATSTLIVHCTLTGVTHLYSTLVETADDLLKTLSLNHEGIAIAISGIDIDAVPQIDLESLMGRPDPVGEIARLLKALAHGDALSESHAQLLTAVDQKLLAVSHARVFGSIVDTPLAADAPTLLQRQAWAALDTMVRQRGID